MKLVTDGPTVLAGAENSAFATKANSPDHHVNNNDNIASPVHKVNSAGTNSSTSSVGENANALVNPNSQDHVAQDSYTTTFPLAYAANVQLSSIHKSLSA